MWLRDFLPRDVPNARVYTYGYPSTLQRSGSRARLLDYTTHFLEELLRLCEHKVRLPTDFLLSVQYTDCRHVAATSHIDRT